MTDVLEQAERALEHGEPLQAHDLLDAEVGRDPSSVRVRQLLARALARCGAAKRAHAMLQALHDEGHADEQTLGLLASSCKSLWQEAPARGRELLHEAARYYGRAHAAARAGAPPASCAWTGINAASMTLLSGDVARARDIAAEVRDFCKSALDRVAPGDRAVYWLLATVAEAALVRGDVDEAEEWYARARAVAGDRFADVATTRRQARLLLEHQRHDPARLDACLTLPRVVTFAGHMIDRAGRPTPRFPPSLETAVRDAIVAELRRLDAGFGYASAACGGDILFLEAMLARDAEVHVVLPYVASEFRAHSVDLRNGWGARFDAALKQAASVVTATEQRSPGAAATYDYANMLLEGLAAIRARQLGTPISLLALWDGLPGDGLGGTETIVRRWQALGRDVRVIDLGALLNAAGSIVVKSAAPPAPVTPAADGDKHVVAMLFADAVGFSRLTEEEVPRFVSEFLGAIGELLAVTPDRPVLRNTWGDGLYFVFKDVARAGRFALALRDVVEGIHWPDRGLPGHLGLRIALHAGPVFQCVDPVTQQPNYIGSHVSRAARMEPITPPGQVYASQSFVAIAAAYGVSDFEWDYVGRVPLAKDYGTAPMYHLRRA